MKTSNDENSITIKLVAEKAGVSVATAARVMGGYGSFSEKARKKVIKAAGELSYMPNAIAKSMRQKRTNTIGIVVSDIQAPFFSKLVWTIDNVVSKHGYNVLICNTDEITDKEIKHLRALYERRVDGLIVSSTLRNNVEISEEQRALYEGDIPVLFVDRRVNGINCPLVASDNYKGSYDGAKYLLELGHRKIGVIASNQNINSIKDRLDGFKAALKEYNVEFDENNMVSYCERAHIHEDAVASSYNFLLSHPDITAIYAINHPVYRATWSVLKSLNKKIPEEISILGWGDSELAEALQMTVITQPVRSMGTCAAEMMLDMIEGNSPSKEYIFDTEIISRYSCRKL